jgi:hypothetical protein
VSDRDFTPPQIARMCAVSVHTVAHWIKTGQLSAWNAGRGAKRPRWRIEPSALEAFRQSRSVQPKPARPRRRAKATPDYTRYF